MWKYTEEVPVNNENVGDENQEREEYYKTVLRYLRNFCFAAFATIVIFFIALLGALATFATYAYEQKSELYEARPVYVVSPKNCACIPDEDGDGSTVVCKSE